MRLTEEEIGYQLQKKYLNNKKISAYKVGASNYRSSDYFGRDEILLGGIEEQAIYYNEICKDYPICEVEVIVKISINSMAENKYRIDEYYLGIECPLLTVENPEGSTLVCLADNCSAGDLIIFQKIDDPMPRHVDVLVNEKIVCTGSYEKMKYPVSEIVDASFKLMNQHDLPFISKEIYIAIGGMTETFPLAAGDKVSLINK